MNDKYKEMLEKEFGEIKLPETKEEFEKMIEYVADAMERVSYNDWYLSMAILCLKTWWNDKVEKQAKEKWAKTKDEKLIL